MGKVNKKNNTNETATVTNNKKKPFDKRKWRENKYSKKIKLQEWEERRKKAVLRNYYKELKKDGHNFPNLNRNPKDKNQQESEILSKSSKRGPYINAYERAKQELAKKKQEIQEKKDAEAKRKAEIKEALEKHRQKRFELNKKLSKRNKKGQPIMKERIELLLEKIQKDKENS